MESVPLLFLVLLTCDNVNSESLLDRLYAESELGYGSLYHPPDRDTLGTDAMVGPRSLNEVGTLRGNAIMTRQPGGYIDDNGVPVPYLRDTERGSQNVQRHRQSLGR